MVSIYEGTSEVSTRVSRDPFLGDVSRNSHILSSGGAHVGGCLGEFTHFEVSSDLFLEEALRNSHILRSQGHEKHIGVRHMADRSWSLFMKEHRR